MVENQGNNIPDYIIDLEEVPNFLTDKIIQNIQNQLQEVENLNEVNFLFQSVLYYIILYYITMNQILTHIIISHIIILEPMLY